MLQRSTKRLQAFVPTLLRVVVGATFLLHGLPKLQNMAGTARFFGQLGFPLPEAVALFIGLLEVVGGVLLILGLVTRWVALLFVCEMIVAIVLVKAKVGYIAPPGQGAGAELDVLLLVGAFAVLVLGPGALAAERS